MAEEIEQLLEGNRTWAASKVAEDPEFFTAMTAGQSPKFLWIGCADSRVPATVATGLGPGDLFVHRNVANVVRSDDPNCAAVVEHALKNLKISHVLVVGHYGCAGVGAAMSESDGSRVGEWVSPIRTLFNESGLTGDDAHSQLCELNARAQAESLANSPEVRSVAASGQSVHVHPLIYDLNSGQLRELGESITVSS